MVRVQYSAVLAALGAPRPERQVAVALIDSGVAAGHPLVGAVQESVAVVRNGRGEVLMTPAAGDALGHGTACAMVIRAYCPAAHIQSIRIFEDKLEAPLELLELALDYAVARRVQVISLSARVARGERRREGLDKLCSLADRRGIIIVRPAAARGDMGIGNAPIVFAARASETCRWGEFLIGEALGSGIGAHPYAVHLPGVDRKDNFRGDSMATAHTTGFLAAVLQRIPVESREGFLECLSNHLRDQRPKMRPRSPRMMR